MAYELIVTTPSECEVRLMRMFDAPRPLVWDCWTKPELLRRWLTGPPGQWAEFSPRWYSRLIATRVTRGRPPTPRRRTPVASCGAPR